MQAPRRCCWPASQFLGFRCALGAVAVESAASPRAEWFYWTTITLSRTPGTALGDWAADEGGLGCPGAAMASGFMLSTVVALWRFTTLSRVALFGLVFILTRPPGATVGDFIDKPLGQGGLDLGRPIASAAPATGIIGHIAFLPQRAGSHPQARTGDLA